MGVRLEEVCDVDLEWAIKVGGRFHTPLQMLGMRSSSGWREEVNIREMPMAFGDTAVLITAFELIGNGKSQVLIPSCIGTCIWPSIS